MRVILSTNATARDVGEVVRTVRENTSVPCDYDVSSLDGRIVIDFSYIGVDPDRELLLRCPGVEEIEDIPSLYNAASVNGRRPEKRAIEIPFADVDIGGDEFVVMAGPCAVETPDRMLEIARMAKNAGAKILRGGAFKPRTSPYSFQGLGEEGLKILAEIREQVGIAVVTEAMEPLTVSMVSEIADIIQIGSRNMQNFPLLKAVGHQPKPVLLKRGMSATLEEWLSAAEYVISEGNPNIILCERGIRTFSTHSRHTLDIGVITAIRDLSPLPVVIDPSHATGNAGRVPSMAMASIAAGADGLLVEIHPEPHLAYSDGFQALNFEEFGSMMDDLDRIAMAVGRRIKIPS